MSDLGTQRLWDIIKLVFSSTITLCYACHSSLWAMAIALRSPNLALAPWPLSAFRIFYFEVTNHARIVQRVKGQALATTMWWGLE